jgi:hypothetical protein
MADPRPHEWAEEPHEADLAPPEPAPADWQPPAPVEARIETTAGVEVEIEERELEQARRSKRRRFWVTTAVYAALWVCTLVFIHAGQNPLFSLAVLGVFYLLTLPFVLRTPKRLRGRKPKLVDRMGFYSKLMMSVAVFLLVYLPFTLFTNAIIPFAALVEYVLFALLVFLLLRLGARSVGIAPSIEALPPPSHRLHQQVVAPIDDAHYQRTLWLNFSFVEKSRGGRQLARRLDEILDHNGVEPARRATLLAELSAYEDGGGLQLFGAGRGRREQERERRARLLERLFAQINQELEHTA